VTKRVMPQSCFGYVRVSTRRQAKEGNGLAAQLDRMEAFAAANDIKIVELYEDVASASGERSLGRRGDLQAVLRRAAEAKLPILVDRIDRLSRDVSVLKQLLKPGLRIYSASTGRRVTKKELREEVRRAQDEARAISASASDGHERRIRRGHRAAPGLKAGDRRQGTISNVLRAERKAKELADFLRRETAWLNRSMQALANHLNAIGLLNLVSERDGIRKLWTRAALREPLRQAKVLLQMDDEDDDDQFLTTEQPDWRGLTDGEVSALVESQQPSDVAPADSSGAGKQGDDKADWYRDHPEFGIF